MNWTIDNELGVAAREADGVLQVKALGADGSKRIVAAYLAAFGPDSPHLGWSVDPHDPHGYAIWTISPACRLAFYRALSPRGTLKVPNAGFKKSSSRGFLCAGCLSSIGSSSDAACCVCRHQAGRISSPAATVVA